MKNIFTFFSLYKRLLLGRFISHKELKKIIELSLRINKSHLLYQFLIKQYDPSLRFIKSKETSFVGKGSGGGSLDTYRKVVVENQEFFEKIYFNNSVEYSKTLYFYKNIFHTLQNDTLKIPFLKKIIKGNKLSVFYYEFVHLEKLEKDELFERSLNIYNLLNANYHYKYIDQLNSFQIFTEEAMYKLCKSRVIEKYINSNKYNEILHFIESIEKQLKKEPMLFQHGDLQIGNIYRNGYVVDWDKATYYPLGYDLGYILANKIYSLKAELDIKLLVNKMVEKYIQNNSFLYLKYFTILFLMRVDVSLDIKPVFEELLLEFKLKNNENA